MVKRITKPSGVTLVELMIVVAIIGVVAVSGPKIIQNMTRFSRLNQARLETVRETRDSLNMINKMLRQADASTLTISQGLNQPPYSKVSFTTVDNRNVQFYQDGSQLKLNVDGSTQTLTSLLRYIAFTYPRTDDAGIVSVSITAEKGTYEGKSKALHMAIEKVRVMN